MPREETLKESLNNAEMKKAVEVEGTWLQQAFKIAVIMEQFAFRAHVEHYVPIDDIHFVFEDFILRRKRQGGATGNLTSCWVAAGAVALYLGHPLVNGDNMTLITGYEIWGDQEERIHWQQASLAKGKATNDRLKLWGLYEPGSEHCKDAWRHLATLADKLL